VTYYGIMTGVLYGGSTMPNRAEPPANAKSQIAKIIATLSDTWNRHDMANFAAQCTEDADFVNAVGMHWRGRAEIEAHHVAVHRTMFRSSTLRNLDYSLRLLSPEVVLAHIRWEMTGHESPPGSHFPEVRRGVITAVLVEEGQRWLIAAFHNTDIIPIPMPAGEG
jgi:uncharacterized protein (TIGR02246 family)